MRKSDTAFLGKKGERTAARYLKKHGYRILAKNQHFSHNELDLIAKSADFIAFIEVKTRRVEENELPYLRPAYAVDQGKRRRTAAAALDYLKQEIPKIRLIEPEGTYLLWLDCRELGLSVEELEHLVVDKANLWLDPGFIFGAVGEGFERINIACPRQTLRQAMDQLRDALNAEAFLN